MRRALITGGVVIALGFAAAWAYLGPPIFENVGSLPDGSGGAPRVALTFDDGPNPPSTDELLDVLAVEDVRATFFMTGQHVASHPDAARRVLAAGHYVGNHGWDEERLAAMSPARVRESLERTDVVLRGIGATSPIDVRAAGLAVGYPGAWVYRRMARRHISGTAGGADWTREPAAPTPPCPGWWPADRCPTQDPDAIVSRVLADVEPGGIIVLHDGHDAHDGADRSGTVEAVRRLIPRLRARGYRFVAVQDALEEAGG